MKAVAGIFRTREEAERTAARLSGAGDRVTLLTPGDPAAKAPSEEMEGRGIGKALGGVVGAALGVAGGAELGAAVASAFLPGVGPVMAVGMAGAALLGAGGAAAGAVAGGAIENTLSEGIPKDEMFIYEDALRRGHSVLIGMADDAGQAERWRDVMIEEGAESIDSARRNWWLGLRDAEKEYYREAGHDFERDEDEYRLGFEAALTPECRGKSARECADLLRHRHPDCCASEGFRHGFLRGQSWQAEVRRERVH